MTALVTPLNPLESSPRGARRQPRSSFTPVSFASQLPAITRHSCHSCGFVEASQVLSWKGTWTRPCSEGDDDDDDEDVAPVRRFSEDDEDAVDEVVAPLVGTHARSVKWSSSLFTCTSSFMSFRSLELSSFLVCSR